MIKYLITLLILFSNYLIQANEQNYLEQYYIETMTLTFQSFEEKESTPIWPHFYLTERPTVFHFKNGHVYAFGLAKYPYSSLWEKQFIQHQPILFCAQYPIDLPPLQPAFPLENQQVFVFSLDHQENPTYLSLLTFIHERFHIHQFQSFRKEKVIEPAAADYQNINLLTWMELEHRLLTLFLQSDKKENKLEHLKNYLAVSQTRRQFLHPTSLKWEDHQQKMEGLADYVSIKTFQVLPYIPDFNAEKFLLEMRNKKNKGDISSARDRIKGRHYFVGATLGWALDFCGVENWKFRIEREDISLQAMLENALMIEEKERQERLLQVEQALNWMGIREQVSQQLDKERGEREEIIQTFRAQEGVIIRIGTPSGHMSSGGRHQKIYHVDRKKVLIEDTSIAMSQDQSWMLRFNKIPLVFEEQNGERMFKLDSDITLQLDGKEFSLEEILEGGNSEFPFSSLSLKNEHCELKSKRSGKIGVEGECLFFKFN